MEDDEECSTGLCLGLGMGGYMPKKENQKVNKVERFMYLEKIPERLQHYPTKSTDSDHKTDNKNTCRKKLRLTTEQSAMLENCFKLHTTLNPVFIHTLFLIFYIFLKKTLFLELYIMYIKHSHIYSSIVFFCFLSQGI